MLLLYFGSFSHFLYVEVNWMCRGKHDVPNPVLSQNDAGRRQSLGCVLRRTCLEVTGDVKCSTLYGKERMFVEYAWEREDINLMKTVQ